MRSARRWWESRDGSSRFALPSVAGCGERRPQPTAPVRQSWSRRLRIVVRDPPRENLPFPGICRRFESLKLLQDLERATLAENLRTWCDVLPAQQPAHELRRGHRLDFFAQRAERQPMNAREQPRSHHSVSLPAAPVNCPRKIEPLASSRRRAFSISDSQFRVRRSESVRRHGTAVRHPAGDASTQYIFA